MNIKKIFEFKDVNATVDIEMQRVHSAIYDHEKILEILKIERTAKVLSRIIIQQLDSNLTILEMSPLVYPILNKMEKMGKITSREIPGEFKVYRTIPTNGGLREKVKSKRKETKSEFGEYGLATCK